MSYLLAWIPVLGAGSTLMDLKQAERMQKEQEEQRERENKDVADEKG